MKKNISALIIVAAITCLVHVSLSGIQTQLGSPGVALGSDPIRDREGNVLLTNSIALPHNIGFYTGTPVPVDPATVEWLPPDTTFGFRKYRDVSGFEALTQVVLMKRDRTSIHKPEYCLYGAGLTITRSETTSIPMQKPFPYNLPVTKISVSQKVPQPDGSTLERSGFYFYWFVSEDQIVPGHKDRILLMANDLLRHATLKRWAYISFLSLTIPGNEADLESRMTALIQEAVPFFQLTSPPENLKIAGH